MRVRRTRKGSTADIRTTGFVQLEKHSENIAKKKVQKEEIIETTANQMCKETQPKNLKQFARKRKIKQMTGETGPTSSNMNHEDMKDMQPPLECEPGNQPHEETKDMRPSSELETGTKPHEETKDMQLPSEWETGPTSSNMSVLRDSLRQYERRTTNNDFDHYKEVKRRKLRKTASKRNHLSEDMEDHVEDDDSTKRTRSQRKDRLQMVEECLKFLEQIELFKNTAVLLESDSPPPVHPGCTGDGQITENCKICGKPEDQNGTLICDTCEHTYHISCCKIRNIPRDDRWICNMCTRKRKKKSAELKMFPAGHLDEKLPDTWKIDKTKIRGWDLERMERTHVRVGPKYQAVVPPWTGKVSYDDIPANYPGFEVPRSSDDKLKEKEITEHNVVNNIWPLGWLPARSLPEGEKESWLQCQNILYEAGDSLPDGQVATKDIICGKWRRAPLHVVPEEGWECSCAVTWDPRHADCAVAQEIPTEEIKKRSNAKMQSQPQPEEVKCSGNSKRVRVHNQNFADYF